MRVLISIEREDVKPAVRDIGAGMTDRQTQNNAMAQGALVPVQRNFRALTASNHNQLGAPSSGFWQRMQSATYADADETSGYIRMPREVALRYFGGTVTPVKANNLAIPARTEAYNKSPRDFSDLRLVIFGNTGTMALVQAAQTAISYRKTKKGVRIVKGQEKGGLVFYWLVKSATIRGDDTVLPSEEELRSAAQAALDDYFQLVLRRASQ